LRALLLALVLLLPAAALAQGSAVPPITGRDLLFALHKLSGTEPDYEALVAEEAASRPPEPRRWRDEAAERRWLHALALRRMRAAFAAFDLDQPFAIAAETEIAGYDRERGGIPFDAGLIQDWVVHDPSQPGRAVRLRFRDTQAIGTIPAADRAAAAALLEGAGLIPFGDWAGRGRLTVTFVLAAALPRLAEVEAPAVAVEVLTARLEGPSGVVLHALVWPEARAAARRARSAGLPPLGLAALGGLAPGMAWEEVAPPAGFADQRGLAWFAGLPEAAQGPRAPDCSAGVVADIRAFGIPLAPEDSFAGCLAVALDADQARVESVTELRFLPRALLAEARTDLQERLGPPLEELPHGQLAWVGRGPGDALLELRADMVRVAQGGPGREPGVLLALALRPYRPPGEEGS
jgi:hypothetical protein